jgi:hypothetical protein
LLTKRRTESFHSAGPTSRDARISFSERTHTLQVRVHPPGRSCDT